VSLAGKGIISKFSMLLFKFGKENFMPSSRPSALAQMCNRIMEKNPMSVLDIGVGFGKFGFLAREYTDVRLGRYFDWKTRIDGIEIFEKYITHLQRQIYDNIYIGNAIDILPTLNQYDMIICSDMLEHLNSKDGLLLLDLIRKKSKFAMIATPVRVLQQEAIYNNEYERHISVWPREELKKWGDVYKFDNTFLLEIESIKQAKMGDTIKVRYTCKFNDGTVYASNSNGDPVQITIGHGQVIPSFEEAVLGMGPGECKTTMVKAADAFGPYRKDMTQVIEREQFPKQIEPVIGQVLQDHQEDGSVIEVKVKDVSESTVTLDANHPLAGKDLIYDIQLVEII
jgi:peptidylprolyl isomerase